VSPIRDDVARVLISEIELQRRIRELGQEIGADYRDRAPLLIGVLKGATMFLVDLARAIDRPIAIDFMAVSSYGASTQSSGVVRILKDLDQAIDGRDILVVEDIVDTALTLRYIVDNLRDRGPSSVRICALLLKLKRRESVIAIDYVGFEIPDEFVVGYGLDYAETYRNLPFVGILRPEVYRGG
jgi:hypoxanthine phosphoribosyltransferase